MTKKPVRRGPFTAPAPQDLQTEGALRAFNTFTRTIGKETTKANKQELARRKAMGDALPALIDTLDEEALTALFYGLEACATASDRKKIATHPQRPEGVDALHAEAEAARKAQEQAEAEAEKAADAKVARGDKSDGAASADKTKGGGDASAADAAQAGQG